MSKKRRGIPPGPQGLPLLGNVFQLPPFMFLRFTEWKKQFGPLFSLNLAGQLVVVINSLEVATDLLEQRSSIYSDRPRFIVAGELLTRQLVLPLVGYGSFWKKLRKASHEPLKSQTVPMYHRPQEIEAAILVENLINRPELWAAEIKRSTASSIKAVIYGTPPIASIDDPVVAFISEMGHRFSTAVMPGAYLVELFPTMLYLPTWLAPWKREAMEWYEASTEKLQGFIQPIREQADDGTDDRPSFAKQLYIAGDRHQLVLKEEAWLAGSMFVAGFDTSYASLEFFVLAMRLYPDVMKKAQAELDRVVGRGRVPSVSDSDDLPYVRALVKEVLRWGTPMPIGVPRRTQQDDYYNGHFIPKGTLVMVNSWGINNDPTIFPDPHEFKPERYLDATGTMDVDIPGTHNQGHVSFGFGRRLCVGMNLAAQFLFINVATILWAANVEPAYDQNGQIITPTNSPADWADEGGLIRPAPFRCHIVPRFDGGEAMLRRAREQGRS